MCLQKEKKSFLSLASYIAFPLEVKEKHTLLSLSSSSTDAVSRVYVLASDTLLSLHLSSLFHVRISGDREP